MEYTEYTGNVPEDRDTSTTSTTSTVSTTTAVELGAREAFWAAQGQPWRTEPEIDEERQRFLVERRAITAVPREGIFGFTGVRLSRADVEWLLATLDDQSGFRGPVDWSDERQRGRPGLDVRGADLSGVDLHGLPLANLVAEGAKSFNWVPRPGSGETDPGVVHFDDANLAEAHLEGALLGRSCLKGANLRGAALTQTSFLGASLEGACLDDAHGADTYLNSANLAGASARGIVLERATSRYTTMDDMDATGAHLIACQIYAKSMHRIHLDDARLTETDLHVEANDASLRRAHLEGATLYFNGRRCDLTDAHLEGATLTGGLDDAVLTRAHLEGAILQGLMVRGGTFDGACFDGVDFSKGSMRGADFSQETPGASDAYVDLSGLSFLKANLSGATLRLPNLRGARLDGADLTGAKVEGGDCVGTSLAGATLAGALFVPADLFNSKQHPRVDLSGADLHGANPTGAYLVGATLVGAHLEGADCTEANLSGADLSGAFLAGTCLYHTQFDAQTNIDDALLQDRKHGGAFLGAVRWGGADIARTHWQTFTRSGEDREAGRSRAAAGERKDHATRAEEYGAAVRFYRQLALALAEHEVGLDAPEERYLYRAQVLQRRVFWHQRSYGRWGFSLMLAALSGYGYRLQRILVAYLTVLATFACLYLALGLLFPADSPLTWQSAFLSSLTAFHGRVFAMSFTLGSPQAWASAVEGICGLIVESVFIAMLTNKFFGK